MKVNQPSARPTRKVGAMALGGAAAAVAMGVFGAAYPDIAGRLGPGFEGGLAVLVGAFFGYMTRDSV